jgi:hypothetical protein
MTQPQPTDSPRGEVLKDEAREWQTPTLTLLGDALPLTRSSQVGIGDDGTAFISAS